MFFWTYGLAPLLLVLIPKISLAWIQTDEILPFPAESCQAFWKDQDPQNYLYDPSHDKGYPAFNHRMMSQGLVRKNCHKTWTVLVYMSVTDDLIPYAYADLLEMETAPFYSENKNTPAGLQSTLNPGTGSSLRTDVLVQMKTEGSQFIQRLHMFESQKGQIQNLKKSDIFKLSQSQINSPEVIHFTRPTPTSEAQLLEDFLKWGIEHYPSEHYFVIIWGHGQGWTSIEAKAMEGLPSIDRPKFTFTGRFGGLAADGGSYLTIPALRKVLRNVEQWTGDTIAVFASDACLMQSVEDVTELGEHTKFISGSEDIASYAGFPYNNVFNQLNSGIFKGDLTQGEPYLVAWMMPQLYKDSFNPSRGSQRDIDPRAYQELTGCSISSKHLRTTLVPSLNQLGTKLVEFIYEEEMRWIDLKELVQRGPCFQGGTQDIGSFLERLSDLLDKDILNHENGATPTAAQLRQTIWKTYAALNYTVVNASLGESYPKFDPNHQLGPRGLSIWLPSSDEEFVTRFEDFSQSRFYGNESNSLPGWKKWMLKIYPKGVAMAMNLRTL